MLLKEGRGYLFENFPCKLGFEIAVILRGSSFVVNATMLTCVIISLVKYFVCKDHLGIVVIIFGSGAIVVLLFLH